MTMHYSFGSKKLLILKKKDLVFLFLMYTCLLNILFSKGLFDPDPPAPKLPHSPLYNPLLEGKLPSGFIVDLIKTTTDTNWDEFKMVFTPLLQSLVTEGMIFFVTLVI